jgi:hypothetical protein
MGNRCCVANVLEIPNRDTYARMRNIPVGRCRHCSISAQAELLQLILLPSPVLWTAYDSGWICTE